jgi:hypothetical protein
VKQTFEDRFGVAADVRSWLYADAWLRHCPVRVVNDRFERLPQPQLPMYRKSLSAILEAPVQRKRRPTIEPLLYEPALWLPLSCAISKIQRFQASTSSSSGSVTTNGTDGSGTVAAGNLLVACFMAQSNGVAPSSIVDTGGNAYTIVPSAPINDPSNINYQYIAYAKNVTGGASFSATVNWGSAFPFESLALYEFSGVDTVAPEVGDNVATGNSTSVASGTLTIAQASVIVAQLIADGGSVAGTNGYIASQQSSISLVYDMYHLTSANEAATASASTGAWAIVAAAFKSAAGGAVVDIESYLRQMQPMNNYRPTIVVH